MRVLLPTVLAAFATPAAARTEQDFQSWVNVTVFGTIAKDLVFFAEAQPRFRADSSRLSQLLLRPAIGLKVTPTLTVYQGYAHVITTVDGGRDRNEERAFQQVQWVPSTRFWSRTRLEERWQSNGRDTGFRLRQMLRFATPLGTRERGRRLAAIVSAEGFFALNDTDWGARSGFDQLRAFAGLEIPLMGRSTVEAGYMNQLINDPGGRRRSNHILAVNLFLRP